jgi:hypothetical protein
MLTPGELQERLLSSGLADTKTLRPCSAGDVRAVQRTVTHPLPTPYIDFLRSIGRGAGDFMSDLTIFYPELLSNTESMRKLMSQDSAPLPANAFVICHRYGSQMLYFLLGESDDPAIFRWHDEEPYEFRQVFSHLWDWIEEELAGHEYMLG